MSKNIDKSKGALGGNRYRVIVSTDIGGTDPDDFQSMVHLLLYADVLDIEGLISSSGIGGKGRKQDIFDVIDCYEKDYEALTKHSDNYPTPDALRAITAQGAIDFPPYAGVDKPTEGSQLIIDCARRDDPRPIYILGWGGIEDVAQALHDAPDIINKLRMYWISGPNKKWGPQQYQYVIENHPEFSIIEVNSTYRGWFVGGNQEGQWENTEFVTQHIAGKGALGDFFHTKLHGTIKMGDTPSVAWMLTGNPEDPSTPSWGGNFVRAWERPFLRLDRLPEEKDRIEEFGILELHLSFDKTSVDKPEAFLDVENQSIPGHVLEDGVMAFRFCPKAARVFEFKVRSNTSLDGQSGSITAFTPELGKIRTPDSKTPNWWTDDPSQEAAIIGHKGVHTIMGAKTVCRWREEFLQDFADRISRCQK